ncbi:MAG TPA: PIN domain-containing protein [Candidatus Nanoarchaeia archaeon]|nr:PIN domain-containing protein [Candidatus Nanoarchaeia archaeon]
MTDSKLLDSSAWLSYIYAENSEIKKIVDSKEVLFTSVLSIFEVKKKLLKDKEPFPAIQKSLDFIKKKSLILPVTPGISESAAEISLEHSLSAMDSLIYASALKNNAGFFTLDNDFRGLKNVVVLK